MKILPGFALGLFFLVTVRIADGFDYFYLSDSERTQFGELNQFITGDSLWGSVRTNGYFNCFGGGFVSGPVIMAEDSAPPCFDEDDYSLTQPMLIPGFATPVRELASHAGHFYNPGSYGGAVVQLRYNYMRVYWGIQGTPLDTFAVDFQDINFNYPCNYFFDCPIEIAGILGPYYPETIIASSHDIELYDNVIISEYDTTTHTIPDGAFSKLALVSEESIKIKNTWANGRENSAQGSDIFITAFLVALGGSFTFAQQNDVWEPYRCECTPDERGRIHLNGAIAVRRAGYVHRSNNGGTGYLKDYKYDQRLRFWNFPLFDFIGGLEIPDAVYFGDVEIGTSAHDTLVFDSFADFTFSGVQTFTPFNSIVGYWLTDYFELPISFSPTLPSTFTVPMYFYINGDYHEITLTGTGVEPDTSSSIPLNSYPNPFNASTTFEYSLPRSGDVELVVYDVSGREVERMRESQQSAGKHRLFFEASHLPSGVYFAKLSAAGEIATHKLLLVK